MHVSTRRLTTLIAEDSVLLQELLVEAVQSMPGLKVAAVVDTAANAIAHCESPLPDLVILDLVLREGSGLDVVRALKRHSSPCCVVVFTGHDSEPYRTRCLAEGADYFFSKASQHRELILFLRELGRNAAASGQPAGSVAQR